MIEMDLLSRITTCKTNEEVDIIVNEELERIQSNVASVEQLGFLDFGQSESCYKGFIPFKTRIKYANLNMETYSM